MNEAPRNFEDKSVIITGGGSGVGFETAKLFSNAGANVLITGRSKDKLRLACAALSQNCDYHVGDVSDPATASAIFEKARKKWNQPVFVLINNAGVILRRTAAQTTDEDWRRLMSINVDGLFFMSREAARQLPDDGTIVNLSSTCGRYGAAGLTAYCASKGAVDQITRSMALELAPRRITVNAVAPGAINSPMLYLSTRKRRLKSRRC